MTTWLFRAALRLVPASWRTSVRADIEEDARAQNRGDLWKSWQAVRVATRWRWTFGGGAMLTDLRYVIRSLLAAKWFTAGAVITFALGIGVNIAVFSAIDRLLFRRLPYAHPETLVLLRSCDARTGECTTGSFPSAVAHHLERESSTLTGLAIAGFATRLTPVRDAHSEDFYSMVDVSPRALRVLGVAPMMGRDVTDEEMSAKTRVAWLSEEAWRSRLSADPAVIGRTFWSGDNSVSVIGVLPRGFIPPAWASVNPQWAGLVVAYAGWASIGPEGRVLAPFARLRPGATPEAVQGELAAVQNGLTPAAAQPAPGREHLRADGIQSNLFSRFRPYLWLVVAAAGLVLLMACANLASLLVARGRSREHLAAISVALGASRIRVLTTATMESGVICVAGCALAIAIVASSERLLASVLPPLFSRYAAGVTDLRVLGFALAAACVAALLAGVAPGWRMTKVDVLSVLQRGSRGGGRRPTRSARSLLVIEAALGCLLVLGSVLAVRSFARLADDDLGFNPVGLSLVSVAGRVWPPLEEMQLRIEAALDALRTAPGLAAAAAADNIPTTREGGVRGFTRGEQRGTKIQVTGGYFATMAAPVIAGREFTPSEIASKTHAVILNRTAARLLFPDIPPTSIVGRMWQADGEPAREVVGVVQDFKTAYGDGDERAAIFVPIGTDPSPWRQLVVRAQPGSVLRADTVRSLIQQRLGDVVVRTTYVPDTLDVTLRDARFRAVLLTALALTGLLVAIVGLYAVASYDVALRVHEMGVRLTLGATPSTLKRLILREACWPVIVGVVIGLVGAYWMAQFAQTFLYKLDGRDPLTYALVAGVLISTALLAAWLPARRAAATDPAVVLKAQ